MIQGASSAPGCVCGLGCAGRYGIAHSGDLPLGGQGVSFFRFGALGFVGNCSYECALLLSVSVVTSDIS